MKQYGHVADIAPDRITLQNMEKKHNEIFRQYAQRWREVATQVQPPLLEKETIMLFINTMKAPFINHMLGSVTKSFFGHSNVWRNDRKCHKMWENRGWGKHQEVSVEEERARSE